MTNPVLAALYQGLGFLEQQRARRRQEEMDSEAQKDRQQQRQMRDMDILQKLPEMGRMTDQQGDVSILPDVDPALRNLVTPEVEKRMADPSKFASVGLSTGRQMGVEMYTPEEQLERLARAKKLESAQALADAIKTRQAQEQVALQSKIEFEDWKRRQTPMVGVKGPDGQQVQVPAEDWMRNLRAGPQPRIGSSTNRATGDVTPTITDLDAEGNPRIRTGEAAKGIAASKPAAPKGTGGGTKKNFALIDSQKKNAWTRVEQWFSAQKKLGTQDESTLNEMRLDKLQQVQDRYEEAITRATGEPVEHLDVRTTAAPQQPAQAQQAGGRIRVKVNATGQTGTVDASEFDPKTMTKL